LGQVLAAAFLVEQSIGVTISDDTVGKALSPPPIPASRQSLIPSTS
jgi:hypothetical protein